MNGIRLALLLLLLGLAAGAHAQRLAPLEPPAAQPGHSFADLFRIATSAAPYGEPLAPGAQATFVAQIPAPQPALRVATALPAQPGANASGYVFSIGSTREPQSGLLLLAGLAAVLWVARRRLMHSY